MDELQVAESAEDYLRAVFFRRPEAVSRERPWVTLSWAQTSDGSIALSPGAPAPISGSESLSLTHVLRSQHSAILVGINTVLSDNPRLTTRLVPGPSPRPVVLDSQLRCPPSARIFSAARHDGRPGPVIVTSDAAVRRTPAAVQALSDAGGMVVAAGAAGAGPQGSIDLSRSLKILHGLGLSSLMVEGGGLVLRSFLSTAPVDALAVTIAPHVLDGYRPFPWNLVERYLRQAETQRFRIGNDDVLFSMLHREGLHRDGL